MPKITEADLKKQIKSKELPNVYVLFGDEKYLISYYRNALKTAIVGKKENSFNTHIFSDENINLDDIVDSVEAFPLMCEKKCVIVDDLNIESLNESDLKKLTDLLLDVPPFCVLILSFSTLNIDRKKSAKWKKFLKSIEKCTHIIDFAKRGDIALERQIVSWAKKLGCELSTVDASKIIRNCGNDLLSLRNETEKLCAYADGQTITSEMIDEIVTKNLETNVFALAKAMAATDYKTAYKQLDILFYQKEEPIAVLAVLLSVYVDMYRVRVAIESGRDPQELTKYFDYKNKEFRIKNAVRDARNISTEILKECLNVILKTDIALKSTSIDKRLLMEEMITKLSMLYKRESRF